MGNGFHQPPFKKQSLWKTLNPKFRFPQADVGFDQWPAN